MLNKKNFLLNCEVCDTRKMKEEDYSHFEKMLINTELLLVNESSKSILNRLPVTINQTNGLALPNDMDMELKTVNGSYEITGNTAVAAHTLLIVNGSLQIQPGTEEVLAKYENITVNGSVKCPKSLEGYLGKISVNGSVSTYPDDCVLLDETFAMYDDERLMAALKWLYGNRKQVILFTCTNREIQMLEKLKLPWHLVSI